MANRYFHDFNEIMRRQEQRERESPEEVGLDQFFQTLYADEGLEITLSSNNPLPPGIRQAPRTWQEDFREAIEEAIRLVSDKNHDYDNGWQDMRPSSITDVMLVKVKRIKRGELLAERGESFHVSEDITQVCKDIIAYAAFRILKERGY